MADAIYSMAEVREALAEITDRVHATHERVTITKHGKPYAILISPDDLESLNETLEILSDPALVKDLTEARAEGVEGSIEMTKEQALALIKGKTGGL